MSQRKSLRNRNTLRSSSYGDADPLKDAPTQSAFERFCRASASRLHHHQAIKMSNEPDFHTEVSEESAYSLLEEEEDDDEDDELISQSLLSSPLMTSKRENWPNSNANSIAASQTSAHCSFAVRTRRAKSKKNYNLSKMN